MALIQSISGIRGTIGGLPGEGLTPFDVVKFTSAYGAWILEKAPSAKVVIGRDARLSGDMVNKLVVGTLQALGIDVIDLGLSTTPTVELAVPAEGAQGGIILTASHNPIQWNALKLLNEKGEFISDAEGKRLEAIAQAGTVTFAEVKKLGKHTFITDYIERHVQHVLNLDLVDVEAIKARKFKVIVDAVNSTGGIAVPALLRALDVEVEELYCEPTGHFPHNPEPLPENLRDIADKLKRGKYDMGIVVDPDVDRLCFMCEDGAPFGEEYTLVAVADYVLSQTPGNTVSNLSSTRALRDVTENHGGTYAAAAVGEVNVVDKMKEVDAVIGGEGNGGVIYPASHYGRDALVGIGLFLTHLAKSGKSISRLRASYPNYHISKNKIELTPEIDVDAVLEAIKEKYKKQPVNTIDGVKIEFDKEWVHLRKSNTEPIIRIYSESTHLATAEHLANKLIGDIRDVIKGSA
ncbi:phosphoglucomutase/phosphomannomutase alpha/beta/alpha domain I [Nitritalea halalkaliphila LW7]|uniref:Phosphoglucomutase/phosphomannomutase alpha/beta/alpha domain I n=1 Tax=Nitritalea halalkaliphila LW7 TaxID=1189621 RepID=I5BVS9_9BACT|nr:phosphoglucosamine mutase [Nitritalea halalkaliphila]EIM73681.1 phosphoglucomutase/phosphomannomutase alpha/beta/alpha domain I [Nitritalea halalkaliphila LW7]